MIIGIVLYTVNILLCGFSFNQVKTEQLNQLILNGVIFLVVAIASVALFLPSYLIEALIMSIIGVPSIVFIPGMTPNFLYRRIKYFNFACALSVTLLVVVYLLY